MTDQTNEILRLHRVQKELVRELERAWENFYREQGDAHGAHKTVGLLAERRLQWPVRLLWAGLGFTLTQKGLRRDKLQPFRWYSRHGASYWYGVIQYVRLGPVIFELGRDEALRVAPFKGYGEAERLQQRAPVVAKETTLRILARCNQRADRVEAQA